MSQMQFSQTNSHSTRVGETVWVRAERGGFLRFHARPGEIVAAGQALATNNSIFGHERNTLVSPVHGIVLGMTTMPAVKPGEPVYHIAILTDRRYEEVRRRYLASSEDAIYRRVQRDLATNIVLQERPLAEAKAKPRKASEL